MPIILDAVQAVRTSRGTAFSVGATASTTGAINSQIVRLAAQQIAVAYRFSTSSATAGQAATTDTFLPAGAVEFVKCRYGEFLSYIGATGGALAAGLSVAEVVE